MQVWVAVGILMERGRLTNPDALAVLRRHAFSHHLALDSLAADLADQRVPAEAFIH
jgi:AmiR/NasT family two-component response regulator